MRNARVSRHSRAGSWSRPFRAAVLAAALGPAGAPGAGAEPPLQAVLTAPNPQVGDVFGDSIALDGDWLAVGAKGRDGTAADCGAVYLFRREGTSWALQQQLLAPDAGLGDGFGRSVALCGGTLVVGAWGDDAPPMKDCGSAYVFGWDGAAWAHQAKLLPSDLQAGAQFGCSVGLSGDTVVVGAYAAAPAGPSSGLAYVFRREDGAWQQEARLTAHDAAAADYFGWSVAIDGDCIAVGAYGDDDRGDGSGAVYVFERSGTAWTQAVKLTGSQAGPQARLGRQVSLAGGCLVAAGNPAKPETGVYIFRREAGGWREEGRLAPQGGGSAAEFGASVATDGLDVIVGAPGEHAAYAFTNRDGAWCQVARLTGPAGSPRGLGWSVCVGDGCIAAGAIVGSSYDEERGAAAVLSAGTRTAWRADTGGPGQWGDPGGWTAGVPTASMNVVVRGQVVLGAAAAAVRDVQVGPAEPGALEIQAGTLEARDLRIGPHGALRAGAGSTLRLRGSLTCAAAGPDGFDLGRATLRLAAPDSPPARAQSVEAVCRDLGLVAAAWLAPSAVGTLIIESGAWLRLVDEFDNDAGGPAAGEAVYVGHLVVEPGARIDLNGLALYYCNGGVPKRLIPGDADLDGDVDAADLRVLKAHFGGTGLGWTDGDTDGDGDADALDYLAIKANYGVVARAEAPAVPEPASLALLAAAAAATALPRRPARRTRPAGDV